MCKTFEFKIFKTKLGNLFIKLKIGILLQSQAGTNSHIKFLPSTNEGKDIYKIETNCLKLLRFTLVFKRSLGGFTGNVESNIKTKFIKSGRDTPVLFRFGSVSVE